MDCYLIFTSSGQLAAVLPSNTAENGHGGQDIGSFQAQLTVPGLLAFTHKDALGTIPRTSDSTFTWSGGDPANELVVVAGLSGNETAEALFLCLEWAAVGSFTVSSRVLSSLPAIDPQEGTGEAIVFGVPSREAGELTAPGLDFGLFSYWDLILQEVVFGESATVTPQNQ